ncbi:hypothetical protein ACRRTK_021113 [Alexandromys fortis]
MTTPTSRRPCSMVSAALRCAPRPCTLDRLGARPLPWSTTTRAELGGPETLAPGRTARGRRGGALPDAGFRSPDPETQSRSRPAVTACIRYIFGIPPLILVLLPVTSSDCHIQDKEGKAYESVLMVSIDELEAAFLNRAARKLNQFLKMNISEEFNIHLLTVSQGTQTLVNCTSKGKVQTAQPFCRTLETRCQSGLPVSTAIVYTELCLWKPAV